MKKIKERICPLCKKTYTDAPALSRVDNRTLICPECGTRQAHVSAGISRDEQEQIIRAIYQSQG